ncbi:MAG: hypothetical protein AAB932_00105 [Patescibacteria group bacterium]
MDTIIGHERILDFFRTVIDKGRLSHAYCLSGPEHVGKRRIVEEVSSIILGVPREKLLTIPDYTVVAPPVDEKTGVQKRDIDVDAIRDLRTTLSRFSFLGGWKIAVIDGAERLNQSSGNALLKTLEEPAPKTVLFLVTSNDADMPATILSRCQTISVAPVSCDTIRIALEKSGSLHADAEEMARLSRGLPGLAISWREDGVAYEEYKKDVEQFLDLIDKPFFAKIQRTEGLLEEKDPGGAIRERLGEILMLWEILAREMLHNAISESAYRIHHFSSEKTWKDRDIVPLLNRIRESREYLWKNVSPKMLLERVLLEIP